ncbi:thiamine pyrophosphate-binding protein [Kineosporia sp. A_224]|uniref:thiamine pyrophosphate-binding protein n=1 Tax=Kineosporia sp. A_224 TaxID=1962180 RepID=UPI000B4B0DE0|nr:thiamine pyrophosphate-binding protein [Kineosporia sp. A_224]
MTDGSFSADVAHALRDAGVRRLFGVPGGGANLELIDAAAALGLDFVLAHTESAACVMAAVHGRLTGTVGAAVVTRGPGVTSAVNGLAQASLDRYPLLLLSDTVPQDQADRTAHQRLDQVAMSAPLTRWSGLLGSRAPYKDVTAAAALAQRPPAGAVHLALDPSVPGDLVVEPVRTDGSTDGSTDGPLENGPDAVRAAFARARRPVVLVGLDAADLGAPLHAALDAVGCPVLTTYQAKGAVPESWQGYAGLFTGARIEAPLLEQADLVVGVGLDPVEPVPGPWPYPADVVLLHRHPVGTAYFGGRTLLHVGEYGTTLLPLLADLVSTWPAGAGARALAAGRRALDAPGPGLRPQDVVRAVRDEVGDVPVTVDAGAHMLVAMELWQTDRPAHVLISNGLATMGFALPAAIGAALARPAGRVVCLVGDGGLGMVLAELETVARLDLDVAVVVFNDATLSLIELKRSPEVVDTRPVAYRRTDFAAVAAAMGLPSGVATDAAGIRALLAQVPRGPLLVDARVERGAYRQVMAVIRGTSAPPPEDAAPAPDPDRAPTTDEGSRR